MYKVMLHVRMEACDSCSSGSTKSVFIGFEPDVSEFLDNLNQEGLDSLVILATALKVILDLLKYVTS